MVLPRCPGQDRSFWTFEDIFETPCPRCGAPVEFWKDDVAVRCQACGEEIPHPRRAPDCAAWCAYGTQCGMARRL